MLSAANLEAIGAAGLRFIVGSRVTRAPLDLAGHFYWHGNAFTNLQVITTHRVTADPERLKTRAGPVLDPPSTRTPGGRYRSNAHKRAVQDHHTLAAQRDRAQAITDGDKPARKARFVRTTGQPGPPLRPRTHCAWLSGGRSPMALWRQPQLRAHSWKLYGSALVPPACQALEVLVSTAAED
jgi:hypothetical protein